MRIRTNRPAGEAAPAGAKAPSPLRSAGALHKAMDDGRLMECGGNDAALADLALGPVPQGASSAEMAEDGDLPEGWQRVKVANLGRVVTGKTPSTANPEFWNGDIPFITPADLTDGIIRRAGRTISLRGLAVVKELPRHSIAVSCIGYIGKVALIDCDRSATNQQINSVVPSANFDPMFLAFRFQTLRKKLEAAAAVTTVPILNKSNFEEVTLSAPSSAEQRAIAGVLRTVQGAKEACERVLTAMRQLKQSLLHHLFTYGPIPAAQAAHVPLKETEVGPIPEHWRVARIGDVARVQGGFAFKSAHYVENGVRLLRISNVSFGKVVWEDTVYLPESYFEEFVDYALRAGDLVMAITRPVVAKGIKVTRLRQSDSPALLNQRVCRFLPTGNIDMGFLFQILFDRRFVEAISGGALGSQQPNISTGKVEQIPIPLPPLPEQREIAAQLAAVDAKLAAEESRRAALAALFQSLLHHLMTGKVRLPEFVRA